MQLWRETSFKNTEIWPTSILNAKFMYRTFCILFEFLWMQIPCKTDHYLQANIDEKLNWHAVSPRFLQWKDVTEEKYVITPSIPDAAIIVTSPTESRLKLSIHLTSPVIREQVEKEASGGMNSFSSSDLKDLQNIEGVKIKVLLHQMSGGSFWAKYWVLSAF